VTRSCRKITPSRPVSQRTASAQIGRGPHPHQRDPADQLGPQAAHVHLVQAGDDEDGQPPALPEAGDQVRVRRLAEGDDQVGGRPAGGDVGDPVQRAEHGQRQGAAPDRLADQADRVEAELGALAQGPGQPVGDPAGAEDEGAGAAVVAAALPEQGGGADPGQHQAGQDRAPPGPGPGRRQHPGRRDRLDPGHHHPGQPDRERDPGHVVQRGQGQPGPVQADRGQGQQQAGGADQRDPPGAADLPQHDRGDAVGHDQHGPFART
jgi:hypothetical protein